MAGIESNDVELFTQEQDEKEGLSRMFRFFDIFIKHSSKKSEEQISKITTTETTSPDSEVQFKKTSTTETSSPDSEVQFKKTSTTETSPDSEVQFKKTSTTETSPDSEVQFKKTSTTETSPDAEVQFKKTSTTETSPDAEVMFKKTSTTETSPDAEVQFKKTSTTETSPDAEVQFKKTSTTETSPDAEVQTMTTKAKEAVAASAIPLENRRWIQWFHEYKIWVNTKQWICKDELEKEIDKFVKILTTFEMAKYHFFVRKWDAGIEYPIVKLYTSVTGYRIFFSHSYGLNTEMDHLFNQCLPLNNILRIELMNVPYNAPSPQLTYRGNVITAHDMYFLEALSKRNLFLQKVRPSTNPLISTSASSSKANSFANWANKTGSSELEGARKILWKYRFVRLDEKLIRDFEWFCPLSRLGRTARSIEKYSEFPTEEEWIINVDSFQMVAINKKQHFSEVEILVLDHVLQHCDNSCDRFVFSIMNNYCLSKDPAARSEEFSRKGREGLACLYKEFLFLIDDRQLILSPEYKKGFLHYTWKTMQKNTNGLTHNIFEWYIVYNQTRSALSLYGKTNDVGYFITLDFVCLEALDNLLASLEFPTAEESIALYDMKMNAGYLQFKNYFELIFHIKLEENLQSFLSSSQTQHKLLPEFNTIATFVQVYYDKRILLKRFWHMQFKEEEEKFRIAYSYFLNHIKAAIQHPENENYYQKGKNLVSVVNCEDIWRKVMSDLDKLTTGYQK